MTVVLPESFAADQVVLRYRRMTLGGRERLTITGASELCLLDLGNGSGNTQNVLYLGSPKTPPGPFTVPTDYFLNVSYRLNLTGVMRVTLQGTADLTITDDFGTRSRIVLAGSSRGN